MPPLPTGRWKQSRGTSRKAPEEAGGHQSACSSLPPSPTPKPAVSSSCLGITELFSLCVHVAPSACLGLVLLSSTLQVATGCFPVQSLSINHQPETRHAQGSGVLDLVEGSLFLLETSPKTSPSSLFSSAKNGTQSLARQTVYH